MGYSIKQKTVLLALIVASVLHANDNDTLKQACKDQNATACYTYALPMVTGENAKVQDIADKGIAYMREGCALMESKACDFLGEHYFSQKRYRASMPYLEASCDRGVESACVAMGTIYRDGHDTRPDDVKSRIFYEKACDLHSGDACYNVAIIYRGGFGVEKNRAKEKAFYKKACDAGLKVGCDRYVELDNEDKGIETGLWATIKSWFK